MRVLTAVLASHESTVRAAIGPRARRRGSLIGAKRGPHPLFTLCFVPRGAAGACAGERLRPDWSHQSWSVLVPRLSYDCYAVRAGERLRFN